MTELEERRARLFEEMGLPQDVSLLALAEKHKEVLSELSEKDVLLLEKDSLLSEKDALLSEKDLLLSEKDLLLSEKESLICTLQSRLAKYEKANGESSSCPAKAGLKVELNSNNSSTPPSKDPIGYKRTQSLRQPSGKKSGGQPGHKGSTYVVPTESAITSEQKWYPAGTVETHLECYEGDVRYVIDIPSGVMAEVTKHISMCRKDIDGHLIKGEFPEGVNSYVSYGPNLTAFVTYLNTYMNVPFKKLGVLIYSMFNINLSDGTISNMLNKMRKLCKRPYEAIREQVAKSKVVGADESGIDVNGKNYWIWAFQTKTAVFLAVDQRRSREVIKRLFEDEELKRIILESDRWGAYFTDDIKFKDHQLCLSHLLRNLIYCTQAFPDEPWSLDMIELLRDSIHRRKTEGTCGELYGEMQNRLDELLKREFIDEPKCKDDENYMSKLRASLRKYSDYVLTFLLYPDVRYTNNDSEKAVRPVKTKLKVSGCFRSECGADTYAIVGSVLQTATKNGQSPLEALRQIAYSAY